MNSDLKKTNLPAAFVRSWWRSDIRNVLGVVPPLRQQRSHDVNTRLTTHGAQTAQTEVAPPPSSAATPATRCNRSRGGSEVTRRRPAAPALFDWLLFVETLCFLVLVRIRRKGRDRSENTRNQAGSRRLGRVRVSSSAPPPPPRVHATGARSCSLSQTSPGQIL